MTLTISTPTNWNPESNRRCFPSKFKSAYKNREEFIRALFDLKFPRVTGWAASAKNSLETDDGSHCRGGIRVEIPQHDKGRYIVTRGGRVERSSCWTISSLNRSAIKFGAQHYRSKRFVTAVPVTTSFARKQTLAACFFILFHAQRRRVHNLTGHFNPDKAGGIRKLVIRAFVRFHRGDERIVEQAGSCRGGDDVALPAKSFSRTVLVDVRWQSP